MARKRRKKQQSIEKLKVSEKKKRVNGSLGGDIAIFVFLWYGTRYELGDGGLGVFSVVSAERSLIPYSDIDGMEKREGFTLDPVAGLSFRRVAIIVNGKVRVQMSPADRDEFMDELRKRIDGSK